MSEQVSSVDFQMDKTNFGTEWDIALEGVEKKFGTFYVASRELWIKGDRTIWKKLPQHTMDYSIKGRRPRYLQRKAQEYLMENPNAT